MASADGRQQRAFVFRGSMGELGKSSLGILIHSFWYKKLVKTAGFPETTCDARYVLVFSNKVNYV